MDDSADNTEIRTILSTLRPDNPLRQQAMAVLAAPEAPLEDLTPLLQACALPFAFRRREFAVFSWLIDHAALSDQQRAALAEALSKEVESAIMGRRRNRTLWRGSGLGILLLGLAYLALGDATQGRNPFWSEEIADLLFFLFPIAAIGLTFSGPFSVWSDNRRLRELRPVIETLGQLGQPVGMASLATASTYDSLQEAATTALTKITAGLHPGDYGTLPLQAVPALCNALTGTSRKTASVILQAFTLVGDGRAIERVEYLASTDLRPEIREAAIALLPLLQQRALEGQASSLLLRASHAPPDGGQTLLRAAHEQSVTDPAQLLRMVSPEGSEDPI